MSIFKKFAAPLIAVALVAVMGVSLLGTQRTAYAAAVTGTVTGGPITTPGGLVWSSPTVATTGVLTAPIVITEIGTWADADTITLTHAGTTLSGIVATTSLTDITTTAIAYAAGSTVITITTAGNAGAADDTITITAAGVAVGAATTDGATIAAVAAGVNSVPVAALTAKRMMLGWSTTTSTAKPMVTTTPSFEADSTAAGGALCVYVADAAGVVVVSLPVNFTVSLGVVSSGSSKSANSLSKADGTTCTNYRGAGGVATTDTAIVSNSSINQVATLSITLTSPTGTTASKMIVQQPTVLAASPTVNNVSPGYISPTTSTDFAIQVQDSAGLGVNGEVVLITVDKGALVAGFGGACGTSKAVTGTSAAGTLTATATDQKTGVIPMTYCGNQTDAAGQATITAQNISTSMSNVTTTISTAERPGTVDATYASGSISAKVTDAAGNLVADGTPVQFTISSNAGAVSNACTTTSNGAASSAVSLNGSSGTVIVTASWNETGAAAACTAAGGTTGAQSVSTVVNIGNVVTPPPSGGTSGAGGFAAAPVFSASKLAQSVFNGGSIAQLETAVTAAGGTGVWAQDAQGNFVLDIINGGFVNEPFTMAFPDGFAGVTAVTVVGQ